MSDLMRLDREGPIGVLRFLQPAKRNPYSIAFVDELVTHLRKAERDDTIRAVVMTGGDHFSSGGDLVGFQTEIAKGARATSEMVDKVHDGGRAAYLFRNLEERRAVAVTSGVQRNLAAIAALVEEVGADRVLPGHDPALFERYPGPAPGVATICP